MWSVELQMQTKDYFEKMPITEHNTNTKHKFDSIEALIENGWVID